MIENLRSYNSCTQNLSHNTKKKRAKCWNKTLNDLWMNMKKCERDFKRNRKGPNKQICWHSFKIAQQKFDREFRITQRKQQSAKMQKIETLNLSNPTEFWRQIKKLGPAKNKLSL
jgi:hypothetical protein